MTTHPPGMFHDKTSPRCNLPTIDPNSPRYVCPRCARIWRHHPTSGGTVWWWDGHERIELPAERRPPRVEVTA